MAPLRKFDEIAGLRWLKTVSSTFQDVDFDGSLLPLLSNNATIMVLKNCPVTGEHIGIIFVTQYVTIATL